MTIASVDSNDSTAGNPRPMATLTIRNLDDAVRDRLRRRAAEHGHSMEEEVRQILRQVVEPAKPAATTEGLGSRIHRGVGITHPQPLRKPWELRAGSALTKRQPISAEP